MSAYASAQDDLDWRVALTCESGACVGVARRGEYVFIRNTNSVENPTSEFTINEWHHFVAGVKRGDFDGVA